MSSPATTTVENDITAVTAALGQALPIITVVVGALVPGAGAVVALAGSIAKGVASGVPEAISLWNQFQSGTIPTTAQLLAYQSQEQSAFNQAMADITAAQTPVSAAF